MSEEIVVGQRAAGPHPSTARNNALRYEIAPWNIAVLGGAGVYPLISVSAGEYVLSVENIVTTTVSGGAGPAIITGDGDDDDRFHTTGTTTPSAFVDGYYYAADDTIDLTVAADTTTGIGLLVALIARA